MAQGGGYDFRPIITHYLFLVTFLLAFAGWFTAFIGQAATTAQFGNIAVGTLWFAIFLELFLILGVMHTLATDSIGMHRLQISVFGAIAIVFSVNGAHAGLYSSFSAPQAMGAGWLILSFVNILWVLYFTAEEDSTVLNTLDSFGSGSGLTPAGRSDRAGGARRRSHKPQSRSSNGYTGAGKEEHMGMSGIAPIHTGGTGMRQQHSPGGMTNGAHSFGEDSQHRAASPSTPLMSNAVPPGAAAGAGPGNDPERGGNVGNYAYKARALYAYTASPDDPAEISFVKGEILDIVDNNGKWWQARKEDGTTGIVPSNYLQLI
ncbi:hypothetical protein ACGC1H_007562 [Rhizoctonia solani]|uniref:SH3 domain-containing protein n=1 Tax=Rhizoctonia solani TaxID=456999 RepID=A0A8H3AX78_9AGAM|nr:unnamed protein product [Rhizoctonia solani]